MNETGSYPGQPWLWLYQMWYHVPGWRNSLNVDLIAIYMTGAATALLLLVPFIPGLRDIPRWIPVHRLIWRDWNQQSAAGPAGQPETGPPPQPETGPPPQPETGPTPSRPGSYNCTTRMAVPLYAQRDGHPFHRIRAAVGQARLRPVFRPGMRRRSVGRRNARSTSGETLAGFVDEDDRAAGRGADLRLAGVIGHHHDQSPRPASQVTRRGYLRWRRTCSLGIKHACSGPCRSPLLRRCAGFVATLASVWLAGSGPRCLGLAAGWVKERSMAVPGYRWCIPYRRGASDRLCK